MKKSIFFHIILPLAVFWAFAGVQAVAQSNVNMANNGATAGSPFSIAPPANCFFNFFDSGGPGMNYNNGADAHVTFLPTNPATHRVQISFTSFGLETGFDALYIYNSNTVGVNQVPGPQGMTFSGFPAGNWQNISPGTITANTGIAAVGVNAAEALTVQFRSDPSVSAPGWTAIVRQVPIINCSMTAPANQTVQTGAGSVSCFANVTTMLPTFSPGGCQSGYQLQYRINGGSPTVVLDPVTTTIPAPVGANVVTWELIDPCGGGVITSAVQIITVQDNTKPVINCPSNTTLTLPGGQCVANNYSFNVTCTDNCSFNKTGQVDHPFDANAGHAGIMFDVVNLSSSTMTITQFGPSLDVGTWPMEVYFTTNTGSFAGLENNASAWTLAGTQIVMSTSPASATLIPGFNITIPAGQSRGIYITSSTGVPMNYTTGNRQFDDGVLRVSSAPGVGKAYPFGTTFANRSYNGFVKYSVATPNMVEQLSGIPSGGTYPIGTTTNVFRCTDASGNTATCSFTVTVQGYPFPTSSLVCNDLVFIALGPECNTVLNADQILEGGPYKCYDEYIVELDKTLPLGNGPWEPAIINATDIGKTYRVRVTDPVTGNKCTGDIKVIDALPPAINCDPTPITLPFNFLLDPMFSHLTTMELKFTAPGLPQNVVDFQTRSFDLPVNLPMNATVNDVDLRVKISDDAFFNNLLIQIESPSGTVVTVWDQLGGCAPLPLFVRFDDEGLPFLTCDNYTTDKRAQIPLGFGVLSSFDGQLANGTWKIRISDVDGGGDLSKIELAELYITMTGKFSAGFPNGLSPTDVVQTGPQMFTVPAHIAQLFGLDCTDVMLSYTDQTTNLNCPSGLTKQIFRRWEAKDASGNTATCIQQINLLRPSLNDVTFPPNHDGIQAPYFNCGSPYPTPAWVTSQGFQGAPFVFNLPNPPNNNSPITLSYVDTRSQICDGSYTIAREWTATDNCSSGFVKHTQIIRVLDTQGPTFLGTPPNTTVNTDPYDCCARVYLPEVLVTDNCSRIDKISARIIVYDPYTGVEVSQIPVGGGLYNFPGNQPSNPDTLAVFNLSPCVPIGTHTVVYTAEDNCGNTSTMSFQLKVVDYAPPVAACDETTVVAIGLDDPNDCYFANFANCEFAGITWVKATTFDDGSYDNCSPIKLTIRRAAPYSDCINALDKTPCYPNGKSEFDIATGEADSIKFYCCEVGTTLNVILRVYQLNLDGTLSTDEDGDYIYNECQIMVQVQDKLRPVCTAPFNVTVSCEAFDPSLWAYGKPNIYDNCCLDVTKEYQGQKGLTHSVSYANFDSVCNKGTIVRTFRAFDCHGASQTCTQRIVVNYTQNYFVKFPDDVIVTVCNTMGIYGEPQFFGEDCELLATSFTDQVFTVVPDACFKIERTWKVINWCTYNPALPCIIVPNPTPNNISNHVTNLPGPIVSPLGTLAPWAPTVVKLTPDAAQATNFSVYWNANANCYEYKQIIKVIDQVPPIVVCPPSPVVICDQTENDPLLWNESFWWDAQLQTHDLCEAPTDLTISATDFCSGANLNIRYLLFLDLDGDGIMETVVNSVSAPAAGTVNYGNLNTPNFSGGTPRQFDKRNVPALQKYRFGLQTTVNGTNMSASVRWNTPANPNNYVVPELPYGKHKIKWFVSDGCGNETVCEYEIIIKDCKAPTIVCINGLSGNLMQTGMIIVYVSDFLLNAYDNCTPVDHLKFGIRKCGTGTGFPYDDNGLPNISLTFDCSELGTQCVEIWAIDAAGNADYCSTYLIVQDNLGNCGNGSVSVAGLLKTELGDGLEETDVELAGPTFNYFAMTDQNGHYGFNKAVPVQSNYVVMPTKNDNPLNGVTTYDLVLISKHILGTEPFNSPYKMIAADANRSGSITTFDIVELRKLILGIYSELPNNDSWRFVDKSFTFPNPNNPFQTAFPESKTVGAITSNAMNDDFVAVKVGDVNNTAVANSLMSADERSSSTLLFDVHVIGKNSAQEEGKVKTGDVVELKFSAAEQVLGYQFTLNYNDLELVDITPGQGMEASNFAVHAEQNALTTSFHGEQKGEFTLKLRARRSGEISKMVSVSSRITKAEAYQAAADNEVERMAVALRFNGKEGNTTISGIGFELYQNQPNPFYNRTLIGFHLPEATAATLSVFDQSGRLLFRHKANFPAGYNSIPVEKSALSSTGALHYTLETETDSATKTMIHVK